MDELGADPGVASGLVQQPDSLEGSTKRSGAFNMVLTRIQVRELDRQELPLEGLEKSTSSSEN